MARITINQLRRIIKEEVRRVMENSDITPSQEELKQRWSCDADEQSLLDIGLPGDLVDDLMNNVDAVNGMYRFLGTKGADSGFYRDGEKWVSYNY